MVAPLPTPIRGTGLRLPSNPPRSSVLWAVWCFCRFPSTTPPSPTGCGRTARCGVWRSKGFLGAVEGARLRQVERAQSIILRTVAGLARESDLALAARDALDETQVATGDPAVRAAALEAGSALRLWLSLADADFRAIDDLSSFTRPPEGSTSPAHRCEDERRAELEMWRDHEIRAAGHRSVAGAPMPTGHVGKSELTLASAPARTRGSSPAPAGTQRCADNRLPRPQWCHPGFGGDASTSRRAGRAQERLCDGRLSG